MNRSTEPVFWRQMAIGRALAETGERGAIRQVESLLRAEDRHVRGNAAFVIARLGAARGFEVIAQILGDRAPRPMAQGVPAGVGRPVEGPSPAQIAADRYYAAHLLGDVRDPRGVPSVADAARHALALIK